jgi:ribonuclease J
MTGERLIYMPLGGAGEIGMNAYVYGYGPPDRERLLVVDLGVTFGDMDGTPGIDLILPDIQWLAERRDRIEGIVITHAHEDHIGALGLVWDKLRAPVHARKFTMAIGKLKLEERGAGIPDIHAARGRALAGNLRAGPFKVGMVPISHSIPESAGLVIDTPHGRIVHSGDFKVDPTPVVGEPFVPSVWERSAAAACGRLMCDSTNVFSPHPGRSEASLTDNLGALLREAKGMVIATTFASNVARLRRSPMRHEASGRSVCLWAAPCGGWWRPRSRRGSSRSSPGPSRPRSHAAPARQPAPACHRLPGGAAGGDGTARLQGYMGISLKEGDTFLFSARTIPGNERPWRGS